ncbi:MAG: hypothetical protein CMJ64_21955 [Planctomycetaceae bacterium]|nr:hypothetical protein [Planctomycetaceae bacterium]
MNDKSLWSLALVFTVACATVGRAEDDPAPVISLSDESVEPVLASFGGEQEEFRKVVDGKCATDQCEPWRLFPELPGGITITGWIEAGGTAAADRPTNRFVRPVTFNDREEVVVNQFYSVVERALDTSCGWDVGGRIDILFGTDARFTEVRGLELERDGSASKWNNHRFYRLSTPQAYVEFGVGSLSAKVGHWYTTIGYETVTAPDNFFYSHAYAMAYGEPFTHTGVLVNYDMDGLSVYGAVHNGWDNFDSNTERAALLAGFNWTSTDEVTTLAFALSTGDELNGLGVYSERSVYSIVFGRQLSDKIQYVLQHDNAWQADDGGANIDAEWYGVNQYLFYDINDCWALGARLEWFRDDDGVRVPNWAGNTGTSGSYYNATVGLNWKPTSNLAIRPEARWDWFDGTGNPYADGQRNDQFTASFDAILLF